MKNSKTLVKSTFLFLAFIAFSCSNDDTPAPIVTPLPPANFAGGNFAAKVNGVAITSFLTSINYQNTTISVSGQEISGKSITMQIAGVTGPGTYSLIDTNSSSVIGNGTYSENTGVVSTVKVYSTNNDDCETAGFVPQGSMVITELSATKIAGTFSFRTVGGLSGECNQKEVTEGSFSKNL